MKKYIIKNISNDLSSRISTITLQRFYPLYFVWYILIYECIYNGKLSINKIERITDNKLHNINFKNYAKITAVAIIKTQENMYLSYSFDIPTETLSAAYGYWTQGHYKTSSDTSSCVLYMNQSNIRFVDAYYCGNSVKLDSLEIYAAK